MRKYKRTVKRAKKVETKIFELGPINPVISHVEIKGMTGNQLFHVIMDVILMVGVLLSLPMLIALEAWIGVILAVVFLVMVTVRRSKSDSK